MRKGIMHWFQLRLISENLNSITSERIKIERRTMERERERERFDGEIVCIIEAILVQMPLFNSMNFEYLLYFIFSSMNINIT